MKYIANPVEVDAFEIISVTFYNADDNGFAHCRLSDNSTRQANHEMMSRFMPGPGDYWVIQSGGYIYLNPKEVFERKYRAKVSGE